MTTPTSLPTEDQLTDDLIRYRLVMLPLAVECIVSVLERSHRVAVEFIDDAESGRKIVDMLHEETTELLRMLALAQSSDELERLLQARRDAQDERSVLRAAARRVEVEEAVQTTLKEMSDLPLDDEQVLLFKRLLESLPSIAEEAVDEVTLELLWDQKVRELGLQDILSEEDD